MWDQLWNFFARPDVLLTCTIVSIAIFVLGFLAVPRLAVKLPADHFIRPDRPVFSTQQGWRYYVWTAARNLLGIVLVAAGILMLILPGPGIISIIVGVAISEFPGKRRLESAFIRNWIVRSALNAMRAKYGAAPLLIPGDDNAASASQNDAPIPPPSNSHNSLNGPYHLRFDRHPIHQSLE